LKINAQPGTAVEDKGRNTNDDHHSRHNEGYFSFSDEVYVNIRLNKLHMVSFNAGVC